MGFGQDPEQLGTYYNFYKCHYVSQQKMWARKTGCLVLLQMK